MVNWQLNPELSNTASVSQWDAKTGEEKPNSCVLGLFLIYLPYVTTFLKHFRERETDAVGLIYKNTGHVLWLFSVYSCQHQMQTCWTHAELAFTNTRTLHNI